MRRRVWHEQGVATFAIEEVSEPWLRQAITNEADRRWGQRKGGGRHGGLAKDEAEGNHAAIEVAVAAWRPHGADP
jgi:hypothetical protein